MQMMRRLLASDKGSASGCRIRYNPPTHSKSRLAQTGQLCNGELIVRHSPQPSIRTALLLAGVLTSALLLVFALREIKRNFNPAEWFETHEAEGRLFRLSSWDLELFVCPDAEFIEQNCRSISGPFAFESVQLPMRGALAEHYARLAPSVTHVSFAHTLEPAVQSWATARHSEEYLAAHVVFFRNLRCFFSAEEDVCRAVTEAFPVSPEQTRKGRIRLVLPARGSDRIGPQLFTPVLVERNMLPHAVGIEARGSAAYAAEGIVVFLVTVFLGMLSLTFPGSPAQAVLFVYAFLRASQIALSYAFEVLQPDILLLTFESSGYQIVMLILDALILLTLLYLAAVFVRNSFRITKLEVGYGAAILCVFGGVGATYTSLDDLAVVSHFVRDTFAALFGAIWIMYRLLMNWHEQREQEAPDDTPYAKIFVFLFFLVAYGSACAQSALSSREVPDLLHWENLFFLPGLGLALLVEQWLNKARSTLNAPKSSFEPDSAKA